VPKNKKMGTLGQLNINYKEKCRLCGHNELRLIDAGDVGATKKKKREGEQEKSYLEEDDAYCCC